MTGHKWFSQFDRDVCEGEHPEVSGTCPKKVEGVVDRCGLCGCSLFGLNMANSPPEDCIRLRQHTQEDGGAPASAEYSAQDDPVERFKNFERDDD